MGLNFYCFLLFGAFLPACLGDLSRAHNADALSALKSMVDNRAISPEQQKVCSNYYFPLMEDVSTSYDAALQACHDTAAKAHSDAAGTASVTYEEIQTMSSGLCNKNCDLAFQQTQNYLALFECYNEWATASLNTLFSVSGNATLARNTWNDAQANIENDELKCLAVAFEDYQVRWNAEAQAWNQCVIGNGLTIATTQAPYPTTSTVRTTTWPTTSTVRTTTRPSPTTSTVRTTTRPPTPTTSTVRSTTWVSTTWPTPTTSTLRTTTRPTPTTSTLRTTTRPSPTTSTLRTTTTSRPLPPIEPSTTTYIPQPPLETTTSGLRTTTQFVPPAPVVSTQPPPTTTDRPLLAVFHPIINRPL